MARTSFELMPVDGPRDRRQTSRIVNQAMSGKTNNVSDATILNGQTSVTVTDLLVSAQSCIVAVPENAEAAATNWYITNKTKGSFAITATVATGADAVFCYAIIG